MIEKEKDETVKFNVSMKKSIFDMLEKYSVEMGVNRSAFITFCITTFIQQQRTLDIIEYAKQMQASAPANNNGSVVSSDEVSRLREIIGE